MKGNESTVLLVGNAAPIKGLVEALDRLDLVVEISTHQEFRNLLTLVEPSLVIHLGSDMVEAVVEILRLHSRKTPTGLVVVVDRDDLPRLRSLDRSVLTSLLTTDLSADDAAARIAGLLHREPSRAARPDARVVVCDGDEVRGERIKAFLRSLDIPSIAVPLDVAQTDWSLIKSFSPDRFLADERSLTQEGSVWLQMLQADRDFPDDRLTALNFDDLFIDGKVSLSRVQAQLPGLPLPVSIPPPSKIAVPRPLVPPPKLPPPPAPSTATALPSAGTPALKIEPPSPPPVENAPGVPENGQPVPPPPSQIAPTEPSAAAISGEAEAASGEAGATPNEAEPISRTATTESLGGPTPSPTAHSVSPSAKRSSRWWLLAAALLLAAAAVVWSPLRKSSPVQQALALWHQTFQQHSGPNSDDPPSTPAPSSEDPATKTRLETSPALRADLPPPAVDPAETKRSLWRVKERHLPSCESLVRGDPEQLKRGGLERARGAWNRAKKSLNLGLFEDAQRHMCEAVLINPKSLALEGLVDLHLSLGSPSGAKRWAEKALEIRSERSTTQLLVGDVESQLGHPDEALAIWTKALGVTPDNTSTLERVARSYLKEASLKLKVGDFAAADRLFRRAAMLAPTDARPPAGLAQIRLSHSERDLARMWANLALQLDPNEPDALVVLGDLTLKAGKRSEAEELYKKALVSSPHNQAARLKLEKLTR